MTKLFVGSLPYSITNQQLQDLFSQVGTVVSATVITDKFTGQSKGFGFVEMSDDNEAQTAIKELNESEVSGRKIFVSVARAREERPSHGGGFNRNDNRGGGFNRSGRGDHRGRGGRR